MKRVQKANAETKKNILSDLDRRNSFPQVQFSTVLGSCLNSHYSVFKFSNPNASPRSSR